MRTRILLALAAAVAATLVLAAAASATRLEVRPIERGIRLTFPEFTTTFAYDGGTVTMRCPVTLEGSFHSRTFAKTAGLLIGTIARAVAGESECRSIFTFAGETFEIRAKLLFLAETLPWHLRYASFSGALPAITALNLDLAGASLQAYNLFATTRCLYQPATIQLALTREARGALTGVRVSSGSILQHSADALCERPGATVSGSGSITQQARAEPLTVTLIS